jgi:hypothetical protein
LLSDLLQTENPIMFKLLSVSLLAAGAALAMPAAAGQAVQHLYIQDLSAPVQITYNASFATHTTYLYIGTLDANGKYVDGLDMLLKSVGTPSDKASLGSCFGCVAGSSSSGSSFTFTPGAGAVELVFVWSNNTINKTFYGGAINNGRNPVDATGYMWEQVTYNSGNRATIGFEDGGGKASGGRITDWDFNDLVISLTNVGATPPVPEPETYAMLLAGLGIIGVVARRRRNVGR